MKGRERHLAVTLAIIAVVVLLDRVTKLYIQHGLNNIDTIVVIPGFFNIVHAENPGAAFSILADAGEWRKIVLIGVAAIELVVIGFLLWRRPIDIVLSWALSLIFGGAVGNLWDRIARGTVTDFLQFFFGSYEYPSFNVADSAICIGAALLLLDLLRKRR